MVEILIIFVPIFLPMLDNFGVNPYFFAMLVALNLQTSFLTPPMAMSAYYLKGVLKGQIELLEILEDCYLILGLFCSVWYCSINSLESLSGSLTTCLGNTFHNGGVFTNDR